MRRELHKELELLNRYYDVDEENKLVTIPLKYEKATELIDLNVEAKNNYPISDPAMVSIVEKISTIPPGYQVKLNLIINDYEGYDENILLESLNDFLEFNHYSIIREKKFFFIQAIILLAIGISILVFNVSAKANGYRITLAHGVEYGIWLELAHEKRYAIIQETIDHVGSLEIMPAFNRFLERIG